MEAFVGEPLKSQVRFDSLPQVEWKKCTEAVLTPGNIDIWRFSLQTWLGKIPELYALLGHKEKTSSANFYREQDRNMFIASKALLRMLLGIYIKVNPKIIIFERNERMKPRLNNFSGSGIHYNISHSQDCFLVAVSKDEVGVDVECYKEATIANNEMSYLFTEADLTFINSQTSSIKTFYRLWTRKEALLKGTSQGIIDDMKFVPCLDGSHTIDTKLINSTKFWSVYSFDVDESYAASIAYTGLNRKLCFYQFN